LEEEGPLKIHLKVDGSDCIDGKARDSSAKDKERLIVWKLQNKKKWEFESIF